MISQFIVDLAKIKTLIKSEIWLKIYLEKKCHVKLKCFHGILKLYCLNLPKFKKINYFKINLSLFSRYIKKIINKVNQF